MKKEKFIPSWDLYSLGIISLFLLLQVLRWPVFPLFLDAYYHLSVMLGFDAAAGYVTESFWEYAPVGRPHLYPPLLHILMLLLHRLGLGKIFIARLFDCSIFPLTLSALWLVIKNIFSRRIAFFAVLIASSVFTFYLSLINTLPATLSILCGLLSFLFIEKGRKLSAALFLIFSFYLHGLMPWLMAFVFLIYGLLNRKKLNLCLETILFALISALPLFIHQYSNRSYFSFVRTMEEHLLEINIFVFIFAAPSLFISLRRKGAYYFFFAFALGFFLLAFQYRYRYLCAQGLFGTILLAALALDYIYEKISGSAKSLQYLSAVVILFFIFSPAVILDNKGIRPVFLNSTFINLIPAWKSYERPKEYAIFYPKFYNEIAGIINDNSLEDDIIYSNFNHFAGLLGILSGRATSTAMLKEVKPRQEFDPLSAAKLIIWLKDFKQPEKEPQELAKKYGLNKIKETEIAFIYKNPNTYAKRAVKKPLLPAKILFSLFFLCIGLVILDNLRQFKLKNSKKYFDIF